jgi:hypothetical protein
MKRLVQVPFFFLGFGLGLADDLVGLVFLRGRR